VNGHNYAPTIRLADIATHSSGPEVKSASPRRIRVLLNVAGSQIMRGHTLHIGVDQLIVSVPTPIEKGQECAVFFGLTIEDQIYSIIGNGQIVSCEGTERAGYRAEMKFTVTDKKSRIAIEQLFSKSDSNRIQ